MIIWFIVKKMRHLSTLYVCHWVRRRLISAKSTESEGEHSFDTNTETQVLLPTSKYLLHVRHSYAHLYSGPAGTLYSPHFHSLAKAFLIQSLVVFIEQRKKTRPLIISQEKARSSKSWQLMLLVMSTINRTRYCNHDTNLKP